MPNAHYHVSQLIFQSSGEKDLFYSSLAKCRRLTGMLLSMSQCVVGDRPGRFEPRVVKRRKDQYKKMMQPRNVLRNRLAKVNIRRRCVRKLARVVLS